jgi:glycerol uptake facilitator-like aquaporin
MAFKSEFIASFIFYLTYYIISQFSFKEFDDLRSIEGIIKPLLIGLSYNYAISLDISGGNRVANPMLAFSNWVWMLNVYGSQQVSEDPDSISLFTSNHLGRYIWLYMVTPLISSMLAAKLANKHLASISDSMDMSGPQLLFSDRLLGQ